MRSTISMLALKRSGFALFVAGASPTWQQRPSSPATIKTLLFLTVLTLLFTSTAFITRVESAPISKLLSFQSPDHHPPSQAAQQDEDYVVPQQHSLGRARIRPIQRARVSSSSQAREGSLSAWDILQLHQQRLEEQAAQEGQYQQHQIQQQQIPVVHLHASLEGHAVLDDEDDDAGNEMLDTESEGLLRPDADDEIEETIEGQVLVEEDEEYEGSDGLVGSASRRLMMDGHVSDFDEEGLEDEDSMEDIYEGDASSSSSSREQGRLLVMLRRRR